MGGFPENERLSLLTELVNCGAQIDLWEYASDGHLIGTTSEHLVLDRFFENSGGKAYMLANAGEYHAPVVLGGPMGLMWCAAYQYLENGTFFCYVLGPVLNSELSAQSIENNAQIFSIYLSWKDGFIRLMKSLPVVSSILFFQYALMLHCCVTGERRNRSDLHFQEWTSKAPGEAEENAPRHDRMQVWRTEHALLEMVREGDLNYQDTIGRANMLSGGVRVQGEDPITQAVISCANFTALCTREAIHAGISPEMAYSVGDSYIQSMMECKTITELRSVNHAMYEDFIQRVHKHRTAPRVSIPIGACRDYIELHCEEALDLALLARRTGYSEYHLSRKFKQEMGVPIRTYIQYARVERAKLLLTTTDEPIGQIAQRLQFCSGSHFSDVFQKIAGQKPQQYRREHKKI